MGKVSGIRLEYYLLINFILLLSLAPHGETEGKPVCRIPLQRSHQQES